MKLIMLAITALLLNACDKSPSIPQPRIAVQERADLQKAKDVGKMLEKSDVEQQKNIDNDTK
jgi:hypothetical protein